MIAIDSREVDSDGDEDTDDEESVGTDPDTGRGRRYPSIVVDVDTAQCLGSAARLVLLGIPRST